MTDKIFELAESIQQDLFENFNDKSINFKENKLKTELNKKGFLGIAQINTIAGDIEYNAKKISKCISFADNVGLDALIFPDLTLIGYPMTDVIKRHKIIANDNLNRLKAIAKQTKKTTAFVGFVEPIKTGSATTYYNSVAILANGEIKSIIRKYNFSDQIEQSTSLCKIIPAKYIGTDININVNESIYDIDGVTFGFTNCVKDTKFTKKPDILITSSLYTDNAEKEFQREKEIKKFSKQEKISVIAANQVGSTDNINYIGNSYIYKEGELLSRAKSYKEHLLITNPTESIGKIYPSEEYIPTKNTKFTMNYEPDLKRTYETIIQGVKDYFNKNGIKRACLGLSGGLDSTVCAVIMADAIGKENVFGISMPSKITSKESRTDAEQLALNLGINYTEIPIKEVFNSTESIFNDMFEQIEKSWNCRYKKSFTKDNIQARTRATYLWGISNEFESCIPIATSDKSEAYMGYATINGDMSGGFAPIADVTKTKLFALARWLNKNRTEKNVIPESVILKRPGAELAIDERTGKPLIAEDALMPYEFLDEIIWRIEKNNEDYNDMLNSEFLYETKNSISKEQKTEWLNKFYKRMSSALYKWSILPPSVSIDSDSINKCVYSQPITSSHINYKGSKTKDINT